MSDPFTGGLTGSEVLAEAGDPAAVVTSDPHSSSLEEVISDKGLSGTLGKMKNLAQDGDDPNSGPVFDYADNASDVQDGVKSIVEQASEMASQSSSGTAENVPVPDGVPGGGALLAVLGGLLALFLAFAAFVGGGD